MPDDLCCDVIGYVSHYGLTAMTVGRSKVNRRFEDGHEVPVRLAPCLSASTARPTPTTQP